MCDVPLVLDQRNWLDRMGYLRCPELDTGCMYPVFRKFLADLLFIGEGNLFERNTILKARKWQRNGGYNFMKL